MANLSEQARQLYLSASWTRSQRTNFSFDDDGEPLRAGDAAVLERVVDALAVDELLSLDDDGSLKGVKSRGSLKTFLPFKHMLTLQRLASN